jgi:hypothetical protein
MSRDEQRFGKLSLTISKLVLFSRSAVHILIFFAFSIHQRMFIVFNTCRCRLSHSLWNVCIYQATGYSHVFTYIDRQPLYMMYTLYRSRSRKPVVLLVVSATGYTRFSNVLLARWTCKQKAK